MIRLFPKTRLGWLRFSLVVLLFLVPLLWAHSRFIYMPGSSYRGIPPPPDEGIRKKAARLEKHVKKLALDIGPRNLAHEGSLDESFEYIGRVFREIGYATAGQEYEFANHTVRNLEVEKGGNSLPDEIILVGAHYDTQTNSPGADDNASGVAGLLEISRDLFNQKLNRTVRFVAFVNEEPPYFQQPIMGSWVYARKCRERNEDILGMIALEMIGFYSDEPGSQQYPRPFNLIYPNRGNFIGFVTNGSSASLVRRSIGLFRENAKFPSEGVVCPDRIPEVGWSDHWSFWQEGYPAIMVTDTAFYRNTYYHTPDDTPDKLDFQKMARVAAGLSEVVSGLASAEKF